MRAFQSFFLGGFECSTHRLRNGKRLDLVRATKHDEFAVKDSGSFNVTVYTRHARDYAGI